MFKKIRNYIAKLMLKYFKGGSLLVFPLIVETLLTLVFLPVILRSIAIEDYGAFQFVLAFQFWMLALTGVHISSGAIRGIAKGMDGTFLFAYFSRMKRIIVMSVLGIGISILLYLSNYFLISILLFAVSLFIISGYLFHDSSINYFIAKKRFKEYMLYKTIEGSVAIIISTAVAYLTQNVIYFAISQFGTVIIISFFMWFYIIRKNNLIYAYKKNNIDQECKSFGVKLIPIDLLNAIVSNIAKLITGVFFGFSYLAVFSIADKFRGKFSSLVRLIPSLLYSDFAKVDRKVLVKTINSKLIIIGFISSIVSLIFVLFSWLYIKYFLPEEFYKAIIYLAILSFVFPANVMVIIMHTVLEVHLKLKELSIIGIIPNILKIILILIFGYFGNIIGICVAIALNSWITLGIYYILTIKMKFAINLARKLSLIKTKNLCQK